MCDPIRAAHAAADVSLAIELMPAWEPWVGDVVCLRAGDRPLTNIPLDVARRAGVGIEWGYAGEGPDWLALCLASVIFPLAGSVMHSVRLGRQRVSLLAWEIHHELRRRWIEPIHRAGIVFRQRLLRQWCCAWALSQGKQWDDRGLAHDALMAMLVLVALPGAERMACPYCGSVWEIADVACERGQSLAGAVADHILRPDCCQGAEIV